MILEGIISFFAAKDALAQSQVDVVNRSVQCLLFDYQCFVLYRLHNFPR